jgi:hypothetical protein
LLKFLGIRTAAAALPWRTASRADSGVAGLTARDASPSSRLTIARLNALPSWSLTRTAIGLLSWLPAPPPKM